MMEQNGECKQPEEKSREQINKQREQLRALIRPRIQAAIASPIPDNSVQQSKNESSIQQEKLNSDKMKQRTFNEKYEKVKIIDQGAHAVVWKVRSRKTQNIYACKLTRNGDNEIVQCNINEHKLLLQLDHQNIVKTCEFYLDKNNECSHHVMEYIGGKTLEQILSKHGRLSEYDAKIYIKQLLEAVKTIHQQSICHRDIKSSNIKIKIGSDNQGQLILLDFGVSRKFKFNVAFDKDNNNHHEDLIQVETDQLLTETGTLCIRAPEMINGGGYNEAVDLWAVGILLYEMIYGVNPFFSEYRADIAEKISIAEFAFDDSITASIAVKDLIKRLLCPDPVLRLSVIAALQHPWINQTSQLINKNILSIRTNKKDEQFKTPNYIARKGVRRDVLKYLFMKQPSFKTACEASSPLQRRETLKIVSKNIKEFHEKEDEEGNFKKSLSLSQYEINQLIHIHHKEPVKSKSNFYQESKLI